ncbi:MAG: hypothetical protein VW258_14165, partial [Thalassolituus sp.]
MKLLQVCLLILPLSACSTLSPQNSIPGTPLADDQSAIMPGDEIPVPGSTTDPNPEEELTPPPPATAWDRVVKNFSLDSETMHPRVKRHMDWYIRHPRHLEKVSERAQRYLHYIAAEVERRG